MCRIMSGWHGYAGQTLWIDLSKKKITKKPLTKEIRWPRIENSEYIMTVANTRPLDDCVRTAAVEMILTL